MELKPGYKQTEIGAIPGDWDVAPLAALSTKITDGDHATPKRESAGYLLLSARNVLNGRIDLSDVDYVGELEYRRMRQRCNPEFGDVLISCSGTIGRVVAVPGDIHCVLVRSAALVKTDVKTASGLFLQYWLQSEQAQKQISDSVNQGAQPNLFLNHIERINCPKPLLPEQSAIAAAIADVDALLAAQDALIAKKRVIKQGAMQELLTGKSRLPGFIGQWEVKSLSEIAEVSKGVQLHSSESDASGGYPHYNGGMEPSGFTAHFNTPASTIAISEGGNSCGFVQLIAEPFWCGGHCYAVTPKTVDKRFLFHALKGRQSEIMGLRVGSGLPNVQKTALKAFDLRIPTEVAEQVAITEALSVMDAEIAARQAKRAKTAQLKQGMMQALLTGRIRLV